MDLFMIVLPAFIIFGSGYIAHKVLKFEIKSISKMTLYLMTPFLAFDTFYSNTLNMDYFYIFIFSTLLVVLLASITVIIGKAGRADRTRISAMLLGSVFPNSGNYGAPVVLFAFGSLAFDYAVIIMVIHAFLMNTIGIFIATVGGKESATVKDALMKVCKMPVLYGALFGILFQLIQLDIPSTIMDGISLVGGASIPTVMLILGMQLAEVKLQKFQWDYTGTVTVIRMVASPLLAVVLVSFMPVSDVIKTVFILLAAMPVAANTTMIAVQFDVEPDLLSFTTLITTLLSLLTIPLALYFLGA